MRIILICFLHFPIKANIYKACITITCNKKGTAACSAAFNERPLIRAQLKAFCWKKYQFKRGLQTAI